MIHREGDIRVWGVDRNLYEGSDEFRQFDKLGEEFAELKEALAINDQEGIKDALGDMMVVMAHIAAFRDTNLEACIEHAYHQIKDRKGTVINGIFVKEK